MMEILLRMTEAAEAQARFLDRRQDVERETRFKVSRNIPKITAENPMLLLDEFDAFEKAFEKTNPRSVKEWAITLDDALDGRAKTWRDYVILVDPGRLFYQRTLAAGARDADYQAY